VQLRKAENAEPKEVRARSIAALVGRSGRKAGGRAPFHPAPLAGQSRRDPAGPCL